MIYDRIENINKYKGIFKNLDTAIDYITTHNLTSLINGKTQIDTDSVFVNVMDTNTIPENEGIYECHRKYLDLHIDIIGHERLVTCDYDIHNIKEKYKAADDYELLNGIRKTECCLDSNHFAICMLGEPHMPGISDISDIVHKAVFKILVE